MLRPPCREPAGVSEVTAPGRRCFGSTIHVHFCWHSHLLTFSFQPQTQTSSPPCSCRGSRGGLVPERVSLLPAHARLPLRACVRRAPQGRDPSQFLFPTPPHPPSGPRARRRLSPGCRPRHRLWLTPAPRGPPPGPSTGRLCQPRCHSLLRFRTTWLPSARAPACSASPPPLP